MFEIKMLSALSHIFGYRGMSFILTVYFNSLLIDQFIAVILRYFLTALY